MAVFCEKSVNAAFDAWKKLDKTNTTKDRFWGELAAACKDEAGCPVYASDTLRKYFRKGDSFPSEKAKIIIEAAKSLGIELRLAKQRPTREIVDPELLNLTVMATKQDLPKGAVAPNYIDPNAEHELAISAKVDLGARWIEFGERKGDPALFRARVAVTQGSIAFQTSRAGIKCTTEVKPEGGQLRGSGDPNDLRNHVWVCENTSNESKTIYAPLGNWQGHYSEHDFATFSAAREHMIPTDFQHKFTGALSKEELRSEMTAEMAEAIEARIKEVLSEALHAQTSDLVELARVPLFPDYEDEL